MTANHDDALLALARRFFAAITAGDIAAVREIYAPNAIVWHNSDGLEQGVEQNLRVLAWIAASVRDFRYDDARCQPTPTGFVQQHITRGVAPSGVEFSIPACIVCTVVDGKITRVDEYLDSAHTAALTG